MCFPESDSRFTLTERYGDNLPSPPVEIGERGEDGGAEAEEPHENSKHPGIAVLSPPGSASVSEFRKWQEKSGRCAHHVTIVHAARFLIIYLLVNSSFGLYRNTEISQ